MQSGMGFLYDFQKRIILQTFDELGLKPEILRAIKEKGYDKPMQIQTKAIPVALEGRDLIGCAPTGTGKTAAFMLPILHHLTKGQRPQVVVLAPTRELAIQIGDSVRQYGKYLSFTSVTVYGGVEIEPQTRALRKGADIVIATPGRLLDHMRRGNVSFKTTRYLVLDEADRMLDMGFINDMEQIISTMPKQRQTLLFSATMPAEIQRLAKRYMKEAVQINAAPPATIAAGITHRVYPVPYSLKKQLLMGLLRDEPVDSALIFTRTRRGADNLTRFLERKNMSVTRLHSDRTQRQRQDALTGFRSGKFKILVATDIAARGLDIPRVSHVFNYNLPECVEDYVHRAGRTARAEGTGFAFCLMAPEEIDLYNAIETQLGREKMAWSSHPGFDYLNEPPAPADHRSPPQRTDSGAARGRRFNTPSGGRSPRSASSGIRRPASIQASDRAESSVASSPKSFYGRTTRTRRTG